MKVIIVGGGAAGMMAAIAAAEKGHAVELLERNEKLGKKIYITGKGRCNVTNACDLEEFFDNIVSSPLSEIIRRAVDIAQSTASESATIRAACLSTSAIAFFVW